VVADEVFRRLDFGCIRHDGDIPHQGDISEGKKRIHLEPFSSLMTSKKQVLRSMVPNIMQTTKSGVETKDLVSITADEDEKRSKPHGKDGSKKGKNSPAKSGTENVENKPKERAVAPAKASGTTDTCGEVEICKTSRSKARKLRRQRQKKRYSTDDEQPPLLSTPRNEDISSTNDPPQPPSPTGSPNSLVDEETIPDEAPVVKQPPLDEDEDDGATDKGTGEFNVVVEATRVAEISDVTPQSLSSDNDAVSAEPDQMAKGIESTADFAVLKITENSDTLEAKNIQAPNSEDAIASSLLEQDAVASDVLADNGVVSLAVDDPPTILVASSEVATANRSLEAYADDEKKGGKEDCACTACALM
jgi:hypothetical protein